MKNEKRVLIIGANFTNKGAEAMLNVVKQQLKRNFGEVTCYMVCREYERELAEGQGFIPVFSVVNPLRLKWNSFSYRVKGKLYKLMTGKTRPWYFPFPFQAIDKIINGLDAIIDISGFAYADSWGKPMIRETIRLISRGKQRSVKSYFMPQAWGPFQEPDVAKSAKKMLTMADGFYARDEVSQGYLAGLLGKDAGNIPLLSDIVFSLTDNDTIPQPLGRSVRHLTENRLRIGISPNLRVYEKSAGGGTDNPYMRTMLAISHYCLDVLGAEIVLIPNELFPDGVAHPDDRTLCRQLYALLGKPDRCELLDGYASYETIRNHIRHVDLLISSRFHALIFGFLEQKPVMAISWSHKYRELFGLFGLEKYVLESDAIDEDAVISKFQQLLGEREVVVNDIIARLPILKGRVDTMFSKLLNG